MREIKFRGKRLDNELELMLSAATLRSDGDNLRMDFGTGERGLVRGQDGERDQEFNLSARRGPWSFGLAHGDRRKDDPTGVFGTDAFASGTFQGDRYTVAHLGYIGYFLRIDGSREVEQALSQYLFDVLGIDCLGHVAIPPNSFRVES